MSAPAYLSQLLRQLCSFLQAFGLLRLHAGRLQPLLGLLVITLPSHVKSVPELQRCKASQATLQKLSLEPRGCCACAVAARGCSPGFS